MADSTPNYAFSLPTVGGDSDLWGNFLNVNWSELDDLLSGTGQIDGAILVNVDVTATNLEAAAGDLTDVNINGGEANVTKLGVAESITEGLQTITGTTPTLNPDDGGTIVQWTLNAGIDHTPQVVLDASGKSVTLMVETSTGTITWSGITWINGEPTIEPSAINVIEFWRAGTITYGIYVGST